MNEASQLFEAMRDAALADLLYVAHKVFKDRNAQGAPGSVRSAAKAGMRPYLRYAVRHAKTSRRALIRGDRIEYELERARAFWMLAEAQVEFRQPFMREAEKARSGGAKGGRPKKAERSAAWAEEFDRLKRSPFAPSPLEICDDIADRFNRDHSGKPVTGKTVRNQISEWRVKQGK